MSAVPPTPLAVLAHRCGIEPQWLDNWQRLHHTTPATAAGILKAMGIAAGNPRAIHSSLQQLDEEDWVPLTAPTLVISAARPPEEILLHIPAPEAQTAAALQVSLQIAEEQGGRRRQTFVGSEIRQGETRAVRGRTIRRYGLPFPESLPLGYHTFLVRAEQGAETFSQETTVIVCPESAWLPPEFQDGGKAAGLSVALYGLRSGKNWGCGDLGDLARLTDWAVERLHVSFIGLNPLHAIRNRSPFSHSPYLPLSSLYHNFLYLDLESLPDFAASPGARQLAFSASTRGLIARLRASREVLYEAAAQLKLQVLQLMFQDFLRYYGRRAGEGERRRRFEDYLVREGKRLEHYALFCALDEHFSAGQSGIWSWKQWPEEYRRPDAPGAREFLKRRREDVLFHQYCQWLLDEQLRDVDARARRSGLTFGYYHDLAMAVDEHGADYWANQELFAVGARVGAPPDAFNADGQDWGFPPSHPHRDRVQGYRYFAEQMRQACRHAGLLRIDHVMRLARLFWIPEGMKAADGAYVRYREDDLLGIVALESVRNRTVIVGEDLGIVPEGFRETMRRRQFFGCRLLYFERYADGRFRPPEEYPRDALVSINTHDLATFAAWWEGSDLVTRRAIGLLRTDEEWRQALEERREERRRLIERLVERGFLPPGWSGGIGEPRVEGELHNAVVGFLATTPSRLFLLSQEDLFKEREQQNIPGTVTEHPNWVRTMPWTIEDLLTNPLVRDYALMCRGWVERTGRNQACPMTA